MVPGQTVGAGLVVLKIWRQIFKKTRSAAAGDVMPNPDDERLVRLKELLKLVGLSRSMVYLLLKADSHYFDPTFPKKVNISRRAVAWRYSQIQDWIRAKDKK